MAHFVRANEFDYDKYQDSIGLDIPIPIPDKGYPLDNDNVNKYLNLLAAYGDTEIARIVDKILQNITRVDFAKFQDLIINAAEKFQASLKGKKWFLVLTGLNKSDVWVGRVLHSIKPELFKGVVDVIILDDNFEITAFENHPSCKTLVFFDDGIFTGIHTINTIELLCDKMKEYNDVKPIKFEIFTVSAVFSNLAEQNIGTIRDFKSIRHHSGMTVSSLRELELDDTDFELLREFYELEEADTDISEQFSFYFDHKMPGMNTGIPFILAGQNPYNEMYIPLVSGCEDYDVGLCPPPPYRKAN